MTQVALQKLVFSTMTVAGFVVAARLVR